MYYSAYDFFEKKRIISGEPKSEKRIRIEKQLVQMSKEESALQYSKRVKRNRNRTAAFHITADNAGTLTPHYQPSPAMQMQAQVQLTNQLARAANDSHFSGWLESHLRPGDQMARRNERAKQLVAQVDLSEMGEETPGFAIPPQVQVGKIVLPAVVIKTVAPSEAIEALVLQIDQTTLNEPMQQLYSGYEPLPSLGLHEYLLPGMGMRMS